MTSFAIITALFILAAIIVLIRPLLKAPDINTIDQKQVNLEIFKQRLTELEQDLQQGQIDQDDYDATYQDLEKQLLSDIPEQEEKIITDISSNTNSLIVILVTVPLLTIGAYLYLGNPEAINTPVAKQTTSKAIPHAANKPATQAPSIAEVVIKLEQKLKQEPDNKKFLFLLARSYTHLRQFTKAEGAYERLTKLVTDNPNYWADYADIAAFNQKGKLTGKPYELTKRALSVLPEHPKALWLAGTYHFQQQQYQKALRFWKKLRALLPPESRNLQSLNASIASAEQKLGIKPSVTTQAPVTQRSTSGAAPVAAVSISGVALLSDKLKSRVQPGDTVFIYARASKGPRMPLAVVRKTVKDLPIKFTLNDSMAMMPQMKLSSFKEVVVSARISRSGNAITQSGDLSSATINVTVGSNKELTLEINQVVP